MNAIDLKQRSHSPHARPLWKRDSAPDACLALALRDGRPWNQDRSVGALFGGCPLAGLPDVRLFAQSEPIARQSSGSHNDRR